MNGSHEIDVVARERGTTTLVGSCKWTNARVGLDELALLRRTLGEVSDQLSPSAECWFALFSREGFDYPWQFWLASQTSAFCSSLRQTFLAGSKI